jgi:hypothetical protein
MSDDAKHEQDRLALALRIDFLRDVCVRELRSLSDDLERLARRIESGSRPNNLGELQSRPGFIDCRLAALGELMSVNEGRRLDKAREEEL